MNRLEHDIVEYADVRANDLIVDPAWPSMFGRCVVDVVSHESERITLWLAPSYELRHRPATASLTSRGDTAIEILRESS